MPAKCTPARPGQVVPQAVHACRAAAVSRTCSVGESERHSGVAWLVKALATGYAHWLSALRDLLHTPADAIHRPLNPREDRQERHASLCSVKTRRPGVAWLVKAPATALTGCAARLAALMLCDTTSAPCTAHLHALQWYHAASESCSRMTGRCWLPDLPSLQTLLLELRL